MQLPQKAVSLGPAFCRPVRRGAIPHQPQGVRQASALVDVPGKAVRHHQACRIPGGAQNGLGTQDGGYGGSGRHLGVEGSDMALVDWYALPKLRHCQIPGVAPVLRQPDVEGPGL